MSFQYAEREIFRTFRLGRYDYLDFDVCFLFPADTTESGRYKGNFLQPFMAGINCTFWVGYGFFKKKRDRPIVIANVPGFVFGFLAAFTSL